jgi:hypothetical protein
MLVFIDESGDPGFKVAKGSTPVFALAMVLFDDEAEAQRTQSIIADGLTSLRVKPEFKFNKCSNPRRDGFFELIGGCRFKVRAIVVEKSLIWSERLRSDSEDFYRFFLKSMLKFDNDVLQGARVIIDGSGDRAFKEKLSTSLRRHTAPGAVRQVKMRDSRSEPLVQLADMCVGAIARSYRKDREDAGRWLNMLRPKIDDIWEFK